MGLNLRIHVNIRSFALYVWEGLRRPLVERRSANSSEAVTRKALGKWTEEREEVCQDETLRGVASKFDA